MKRSATHALRLAATITVLSALVAPSRAAEPAIGGPSAALTDVAWTTLGQNEKDSMPVGNGDLAANVWTEPDGDLVLLLAKADAWNESGVPVKLGRVRVTLSPNPFVGDGFTQTLRLGSATVDLRRGDNVLRIWADAKHSTIHVEGRLAEPSAVRASAEFWRKTQPFDAAWPGETDPQVMAGDKKPRGVPDVVFPATADRVAWCHYNAESVYPYVLKQEHLGASIPKFADPLRHRSFGVALVGPGLSSSDDRTLSAASPTRDVRLDVVALSQKQSESPKAWLDAADAAAREERGADLAARRAEHEAWWRAFWDRSWIRVSGDPTATDVTQGYAAQRYMIACSSRGELPPKFNGGLFTVGHDRVATSQPTTAATTTATAGKQSKDEHDPDYRAWGECYWNQNNRLLFWPLIASGDVDLIRPWFDMYLNALPLAAERTRTYYGHAGAHFPETFYFWGLPSLGDFTKGGDNDGFEIASRWQRYHVQGALEVCVQMLDVYDHTGDAAFAREKIVPFADGIVTFYDRHFPRNSANQLTLVPAQSLETYQLVAINPTPDLAALMNALPRLIALPESMTSDAQRKAWARLLKELPPIPIGRTAKGKLPPMGQGDADGRPTILPAEQYGKPGNSENPELYVAFPYRLYGVGKPDLKLAQDTFAARRSPQDTCWGQDGPQGAILGLTDVARKSTVSYFTNYGDQRFKWFWKPAHDWIPDLDNGGDGMLTLQFMLMQCDGKRIQLLPAWPKEWSADFKLHAPFQTTVEGHVEHGQVSGLKVVPEERAKDVVIASQP